MSLCNCRACSALPISPVNPRYHLAPHGAAPLHEWGSECGRGFVSDARFSRGSDQVIARTNRTATKKIYRALAQNVTKGAIAKC